MCLYAAVIVSVFFLSADMAWWVRTIYLARKYSLRSVNIKERVTVASKKECLYCERLKIKEKRRLRERQECVEMKKGRKGKGESRPNDKQVDIPRGSQPSQPHNPWL